MIMRVILSVIRHNEVYLLMMKFRFCFGRIRNLNNKHESFASLPRAPARAISIDSNSAGHFATGNLKSPLSLGASHSGGQQLLYHRESDQRKRKELLVSVGIYL